jgi:L-ascorbate metabolism protein UlaG (beta-lactamase superfamily)
MKSCKTASIYKGLITLIISAMAIPVNSQNLPAFDQIGTNDGNVEIHFIGHGSLMFKMDNQVIYADPVRSSGSYDKLPKADIILITHEHGDHLDPALITDLKKTGTHIFSNRVSAEKLTGSTAMKAGDSQTAGNIVIEAVAAYNIVNERAPGQPFHPKGVGLGYILNYGGKRFYIAGDTENTPEMKALKDIYVAFLPMNLPYTMTPAMVADAAKAFNPSILYPYHYGETKTDEILKLLKDSGIEVRIRNLK